MTRSGLTLACMALLASGPASAAVLETWTEISLQFTNLARAEASDTAVGVTTVTSTGSGPHLQSLSLGLVPGLSLSTVLPVTDPVVSGLGYSEVRLTGVRLRPDLQGDRIGNLSGAIASTAGGLAPSTLPITGEARLCLLWTGCYGPYLPYPVGGTTSLGGRVGIGVGGIVTIGSGSLMVSLLGAPWTVKTVSVFLDTTTGRVTFAEHGFAHGPASLTSSTAQTSGVLQVVSPSHVTTGSQQGTFTAGHFSRILVHFVPEPGLLLLLGAGAAGLAAVGRGRMRRPPDR